MARAQNRIRPIGKQQPSTSDREIVSLRWLLIDIDPVRLSGISSSEMEHQSGIDRAREIVAALSDIGWPFPIVADSGNGAHILYRIDVLASESDLVKQVLKAIAARFDNSEVVVDPTVFNPSRIWKLYGTWARKGDNTPDRPHRMAKLLHIPPDGLRVAPLQLLEKLAVTISAKCENHSRPNGNRFNLAEWIAECGLELLGPEPWNSGQRWIFPVCPWNTDHVRSAYIVQLENGAISAGCHHNSCKGQCWADLRRLYSAQNGIRPRSAGSTSKYVPRELTDPGIKTPRRKPEVWVPGEHNALRFGHNDLVEALRERLPLGISLFRRGTDFIKLVGEPGSLVMRPLNANMLRVLIDENVDLIGINTDRAGGNTTRYRPCTQDLGAAVLAGLSCDAHVPECQTITSFPVWVRNSSRAWYLPGPGYDSQCCHFFDAPKGLIDFSPLPLDPNRPEDRALVFNLLANDKPGIFQHFPWANRGSAVNVLAAVLTILMRPGIDSPTPLFIFTAPLARSGKTLLADTICQVTSGKEIRVQSLPENEGEIRKSLVSSVREGATVILFDNVMQGKTVSSAVLAAFVTSTEFGGRLLGQSQNAFYPNRTVLFLTGNNLALSRELSSRALPVELLPPDAHPEARTGLPNLSDLVARDRLLALSVLHGMIKAWIRQGEPPGRVPGLAGFENWQKPVAGVLNLWGFGADLGSNILSWRSDADTESGDTERFLRIWQGAGGETRDWSARELLDIAGRASLFSELFVREEHGRLIAFSKSVLVSLVAVPHEFLNEEGASQKFRVIRRGSASSRRGSLYRLEVK